MRFHGQLMRKLKNATSVAIFVHVNPDGDAVASSSALYYFLRGIGKKVDMYSDSRLSKEFQWVDTFTYYITSPKNIKYDLGLIVDCPNVDRIGDIKCVLDKCGEIIKIDHHRDGVHYSKYDLVNTRSSSVSEIIAKLFEQNRVKLDKIIADYLFYGIISDTNSFKNQNTTQRTFRAANFLMANGADNVLMAKLAFRNKTIKQVRLDQEFYKNIQFENENKIAYSFINNEFINSLKVCKEDVKGQSDLLIDIESVNLGFVLYEFEPNKIEASIRSKDEYSAKNVASDFGGGGHYNASGFQIESENMKKTVNKVVKSCQKEIEKCERV